MTAPSSPTAVGSPSSSVSSGTLVQPVSAAIGSRGPARAAGSSSPLSPSWLAAQGRLPLAFMVLALVWLAVSTAMIMLSPATLALSHAAPAVVTLAHAWVLGVFVTVAVGAIYQIAPVALSTTLWSERYGWWHFWLHAVSVPGMVVSFARWDMALLGHFGTAFALGVGLFAANTWKTVRRSGAGDAVAISLVLATGWLCTTVLLGLLFAANRFWHFIPLDPIALLRAHAHVGLVGFFVTLLQGVTFRLIPMFTLADVSDWRPVRAGLWLSQIGLLGLAPALAWRRGYVAAAFALLVLGGLLASGRSLRAVLATRKKRQLDAGIRAFIGGFAVLVGAGFVGILLVWPGTPWSSAPGGFNAMIYGVLVLLGGLLPVIAGMLCKIVPFLTWMRAYGPKVGRVPTPAAGALTRPHLETWAFRLHCAAMPLLILGVWNESLPLLQIGAWTIATGIALFLWDMAGVLKHLWLTEP